MAAPSKTLILIDGNAIMHRAYHALPPLTTRDGRLVNAVYGFASMLFKIIDDLKPAHLAVAFDTKAPTFRHAKYLAYQAHRPHMEEGLSSQFDTIYEVLAHLEIPIFRQEGFEADDIIGTLAQKASAQKTGISKIIIVTGDRDFFQLVTSKVHLYMPQKGISEYELFDPQKVKHKLGITPQQIIDYKALTGDSSDNYPGVPGIGPKTAVSLLSQYQNLDDIYKHLKQLPPTINQKLSANRNLAQLSQELATIAKSVPIEFNLSAMSFHPLDKQKAISILQDLGFKSLVNRLAGVGERQRSKISKKSNKDNQLNLL